MLCDTNILIEFLKREPLALEIISRLRYERQPIFISVVTATELLAYPDITESEYVRIAGFLNSLTALPVTMAIAHHAALFKRKYRLLLGDSLIAATAMVHNLPLISRDHDFRKVKEIVVRAPQPSLRQQKTLSSPQAFACLAVFLKETSITVVVESKYISETFRLMFAYMWERS